MPMPSISITEKIELALSKKGNPIHGRDNDTMKYASITKWKRSVGMMDKDNDASTKSKKATKKWYEMSLKHWDDEERCPATVDGVLEGYAWMSNCDLEGSMQFVKHIKSNIRPELKLTSDEKGEVPTRACDVGAGIGRVSKGLLLPLGISQCDLIEPSPRLISSAPDYLGASASQCRFFCTGLQDFQPCADSYDIIWMQWVVMYLTDDDLVEVFKRCVTALRKGGVVVIKDNTCLKEAFVVEPEDSSTIRSLPYIIAIAELAGLRVIHQQLQEGFPVDLFPNPMIALAPADTVRGVENCKRQALKHTYAEVAATQR